jgi:hypothetical protein
VLRALSVRWVRCAGCSFFLPAGSLGLRVGPRRVPPWRHAGRVEARSAGPVAAPLSRGRYRTGRTVPSGSATCRSRSESGRRTVLVSMGGCITSALTVTSAVEVVGAVLGAVGSRAGRGVGAVAARGVARLIARQLGKRVSSVRAFVLQTGGVQRHPPRRAQRCLSMPEREEVSRGMAAASPAGRSPHGWDEPRRRCRGSSPVTAAGAATGPRPPTPRRSGGPSGPRKKNPIRPVAMMVPARVQVIAVSLHGRARGGGVLLALDQSGLQGSPGWGWARPRPALLPARRPCHGRPWLPPGSGRGPAPRSSACPEPAALAVG